MSVANRIFICLIGATLSTHLHAQSLNDELLLEKREKLVLQARERGDIVRGAILFHQGNIACAKCHKAGAKEERIGPDLSRLGPDVSPASIVESILLPSEEIKPEYKTVRILTLDGKVLSGSVIKKTASFLRLRDSKDVTKVLEIEFDEIESQVDAKTSLMPAELANELKGKQQFFDLLRYVLDLKERGPVEDSPIQTVARRSLPKELAGLVDFRQHNCGACHTLAADEFTGSVSAPDLSWSAKHLNPAYLSKFISAPHKIK
ncbi:MAG: hypothetical protein AAF394_18410, partial [Planctomycetota bacterium]